MTQTYPVMLEPTEGVKALFDKQEGRIHKKGASELVDMAQIFRVGLKEICTDTCVQVDGHKYEPDFAYIDEEKGIYIDIEVDEPYTSRGKPTHYLLTDGSNKDAARNERFQKAGWYVCRFSEHQIFCHTKSCMKEVYKILVNNGIIDKLPKKLASAPDLEPDARWSEDDSRRLSKQRYRQSYLGYDPCSNKIKDNLRCIILVIPMFFESITNSRLRKELFRQLWNFFFH